MKIKYKILGIIFIFLISCNKAEYNLSNHFNNDNSTTVYLLKNKKKIDSLKLDDYYGKDSIVTFQKEEWNFIYSGRCGSGCSIKNQVILSVKEDRLKQNLHIQASYYENILGDSMFEKYFKRNFSIRKINNKNIEITKTCIKNDSIYYVKSEGLIFDQNKNIYFNRKFNYENNIYKGVQIDSSEYIYYKNKWYVYNNNEQKLYQEL